MAERAATNATPSVRPMWSGLVSFGLVGIQVNLLPAVRSQRLPMRTLTADGMPLRRQFYCPVEDKPVHPEHLVRGYEIEKDQYVLVRDDELDALKPEASRDIDLRRFVDAADIPPRLFERPYFLVPSGNSNKAYRLLAKVMEQAGKAGIATFVMRDKEYLVAILAQHGILRAETLRFEDEIRTPEDVGLPQREEVSARDRRRFEDAIRKLAAKKLDEALLVDAAHQKLVELVHRKRDEGLDLVQPGDPADPGEREPAEEETDEDTVPDLMAVLRASLQQQTVAPDGSLVDDYDDLSAKQLIDRLSDLEPSQLERLRQYEHNHKNRKTVRQAIDRHLSELAGTR